MEAEAKTSSSICCRVKTFCPAYLSDNSEVPWMWVTTASTIITAPSTIMPKSMAPRLIRLPSTPKVFIMPKAKSMLSGMTLATTRPDRQEPKKRSNTKMTMTPPSTRLRAMVPSTRSTRLVRSMKGSTTTPSGSDFCMSAMRCLTRRLTSWKFSPLSMMAIPHTTSPSPLRVTAPKRVACPRCTVATSPMRTGWPSVVLMAMAAMSAMVLTTPIPRM